MKIKTIVTTCERKQPTLDRTLKSLQAARLESILVCHDELIGPKRGVIGNWIYAAESVLGDDNCDAVLMCQDDIVVARGLGAALKKLTWPSDEYGCLSLYTPSKYADQPHGWVSYEGSFAWGACCLLFTSSHFDYFVSALRLCAEREQCITGLDALIGRVLENSTLRLVYHNPSLVQHIGETSTISSESASGWRCASNFVGEDFEEIVWPCVL